MPSKRRLDRQTVIQTAADLANRAGSDALTLGRLAGALGIQPPSLYNHIDGLPGLYRALALRNAHDLGDALAASAAGVSGPAAVMALAKAYRAYIKANPGVYLSSLRASGNLASPDPDLTAAEERVVRTTLAVMASLGLDGEQAVHAVRGLRSLVHGFTTLELAGGFGLPLALDVSFERMVSALVSGLVTSS